MEKQTYIRPAWHKDAKWLCGIFLTFILFLTLITYNFFVLTKKEFAVDFMTMAVATAFSRNGLDDTTEIEEIRAKLKTIPDGKLQPIPNLNLIVTEEDFSKGTPREMRLAFFKKFVGPVYEGKESLNNLTTDPEMQKMITNNGLLKIFTSATHQSAKTILIILSILTVLLLALFVYFSQRFGRVFNPGLILFLTIFPQALVLNFLSYAAKPPPPYNPQLQPSITSMISYIIGTAGKPIIDALAKTYLYLFLLSVLLMISAGIGKIVVRVKNGNKNKV